MANETQFTIDIAAQASGVDAAASAVDVLASRLSAAETAAAKAADAVAAGEASYKQTEAAADRAAKALERINAQMATASGPRLEKLSERQAEAASKASAAADAVRKEAAALDALKTVATQASNGQKQLAQQFDQAKKAAQALDKAASSSKASGDLEGAAKGLKKLGGPIGALAGQAEDMGEGFGKLAESFGTFGALAASATVVVVALVVAIGAAVAATGAWAVSLADAARTNRLLVDGIAGSVEGGAALSKQLDDLESKVPLTRDELVGLAKDAKKAGLEGDALAAHMQDAAEKAAAAKFGPDWSKAMLSLDRQALKFKKNISGLFGALKIEKLLKGLSSLVELFDENNAAGKAIKVVFESIFQPLIDGVVEWIPKMRSAFIQFEILVLKAMIAIKPFGSQILLVAQVLGVLVAVVAGAFVAALAVGVGIAIAFWTALFKFTEATQAAYKAVVEFGRGILDYLGSISLTEMGTNLVTGLVNGITGAGPAVLQALGGVVTGAIDSAKKLLGIASPSKVFAEIGMQTAQGMAGGVDAGTGEVQGSLESLVAPPDAASSGASGGPGASLNLAGATFIFNGVEGAENAEARFSELLTRVLEGDVAQLGRAVPA